MRGQLARDAGDDADRDLQRHQAAPALHLHPGCHMVRLRLVDHAQLVGFGWHRREYDQPRTPRADALPFLHDVLQLGGRRLRVDRAAHVEPHVRDRVSVLLRLWERATDHCSHVRYLPREDGFRNAAPDFRQHRMGGDLHRFDHLVPRRLALLLGGVGGELDARREVAEGRGRTDARRRAGRGLVGGADLGDRACGLHHARLHHHGDVGD
mmetsp:Transcript_81942/g.237638  ORF Transcript_81942/g.237638 Transcript_81942/m.237638 type:complete len:210 (+) Transcript_81942:660-1289(+)